MTRTGIILSVALMQCYASRTQSGCTVISVHDTPAECQTLARDYRKVDNRALAVTRLPVVVSYKCLNLKD